MNRAHAPAPALLLAACAWLPACGLNQAGVAPFNDTIAYPASAALDRYSDWLFVTNSNADLRYNDGTLIALSLSRAQIDRTPNDPSYPAHPEWDTCPLVDYSNPRSDDIHTSRCCWDVLDSNVLNCDERWYVGADGDEGNGGRNVRIGSFAAGMVLQKMKCPVDASQDQSGGEKDCPNCVGATSDSDRLLIGVRGDTSLTWIDVTSIGANAPPILNCVGDDPLQFGDFEACDDAHRIIQADSQLAAPTDMPASTVVPLPDEPYALTIDDANGLLFIGHLTGNTSRPFSGGFSLFDIAPQIQGDPNNQNALPIITLGPPRYIGPFPSPFPATSLGSVGITAMSVRSDNTIGHVVFASSRYVPEVAGLGTTATCPEVGAPGSATPIREIAAFPNGSVYSSPLGGAAETRGIQFVDYSDADIQPRAFVLQRNPPALIGFVEANASPTDNLETCGSPTFLDEHNSGLGTRLFVTCFADGEIDVFDPAVPTLEKTFPAGRGPSGLVFDTKRPVAYVVGFGDNNISVVDLTPGSPTEYHVIQRLGFPRTMPR